MGRGFRQSEGGQDEGRRQEDREEARQEAGDARGEEVHGNERCDEIATAFADESTIDLYKGTLSEYSVDTNNFSGHLIGEKKTSNKSAKARSKATAYSYLSMVDDVIKLHKTWAECEKRVKGQSGAKYKKALSEIEEKEIIKGWESK